MSQIGRKTGGVTPFQHLKATRVMIQYNAVKDKALIERDAQQIAKTEEQSSVVGRWIWRHFQVAT